MPNVASQYHFLFPSERDARHFVHLVVRGNKDVALHRQGHDVSVIDGGAGGREQLLLALALRASPDAS